MAGVDYSEPVHFEREPEWHLESIIVEDEEHTVSESVDNLDGWDFDIYENTRRGNDVAPSTLQNEVKTLRNFVKYLERIEVVEDDLHKKIHIPDVSKAAKSDDTMLTPDDALPLLRAYRNDPELYGKQSHALLELA
jgi:site-specific recombinase XerD